MDILAHHIKKAVEISKNDLEKVMSFFVKETFRKKDFTINDARNYVQAVEVKNVQSTLYVSGQIAIEDDGISSRYEDPN
ncbi:hypothetical protein [Sphingobacterium sp. UBA6320]|uniref:hypothetical protein n=1 Tax=Sphingobacterium sp. UBA6320 TaxID=1947510 RepID=UPI0025E27747|nr:hypothetical protein [Sphingobacterium sp. UBA6320]